MDRNRHNIVGIILAAGKGMRMGETKQLMDIDGLPMLQHVINNALSSELDGVVVVLGHESERITSTLDLSNVTVVENPDDKQGQSSSIKAGIRNLPPEADAVLFLLADQPRVDAGIINRMITAYTESPAPILRPTFKDEPGNPVLMDRRTFPLLEKLSGDTGGRGVFDAFRDQIREVPVGHDGIHIDLDTPEAYRSFLKKNRKARPGQNLLEVFKPETGSVLSFVGAGGKTTAIFTLAREMKELGFHVLITTTTAMYHPDKDGWNYNYLALETNSLKLTTPDLIGGSMTVATPKLDGRASKIRGYEPGAIDSLQQSDRFDYILVEADGSKEKPLKAPADHEPVIPASTRYLLGVIGLGSLDRPLGEKWVHRSHLFSQLTGLEPDHPITVAEIQTLIRSSQGLFKNCPDQAQRILILNGADNKTLCARGCEIGKATTSTETEQQPISKTLICRLNKPQPVLAVYS